MNWLILESQAQLDELNNRMESVFGHEKPYSLGTPVTNGIAVYIHSCVKHMLSEEELESLQTLPTEETE